MRHMRPPGRLGDQLQLQRQPPLPQRLPQIDCVQLRHSYPCLQPRAGCGLLPLHPPSQAWGDCQKDLRHQRKWRQNARCERPQGCWMAAG